jgi:phage tail sheath protein FI
MEASMPEYLAPGVFIEEIERGPRPIEGVSTSTAAFLGETERGPTMPMLVTSYNEYLRYFGGEFGPDKYLPYAMSGFFENGGRRAYVARIVSDTMPTAVVKIGNLELEAVGPGMWGERVTVKIAKGTTTAGTPPVPIGFQLQIAYWDVPGTGTPPTYPDPFADPAATPRPRQVEVFDDLAVDPASSDYYVKRLHGNSVLVRVPDAAPALTAIPAPAGPGQLKFPPPGGGGSNPTAEAPVDLGDYKGIADPPDKRTGLNAMTLDAYREVALMAAPGVRGTLGEQVRDALFSHCENSRFRFAVTDCDPNESKPGTLDASARGKRPTEYGAIYYPWVKVPDLRNGLARLMPPSGHVLGLYARTDIDRGVWKAPANDILRGVFDLQYQTDTGKQEILNPMGINVIRQFPGRGIRVWGARTLSTNSLWKYVSVRRLFIFLERSIYEGTQWVVFEPNDEKLWERVKDTIRLFLRTQWRNGAMMGLTEDEAFTIACDRSTMTQDDILNGRLVCEIGIAPVRPAEFVIFRIFQNTAEAQR